MAPCISVTYQKDLKLRYVHNTRIPGGLNRCIIVHQKQNLAKLTSNILRVCFGSMLPVCFASSHSLIAQDKPHAEVRRPQ